MRKIIFLHGDNCGPCKIAERTIIPRLEESGTVEKINLNERPGIARKLNIQSIPVYLFEEDGELVGRAQKIDVEKAKRWLEKDGRNKSAD